MKFKRQILLAVLILALPLAAWAGGIEDPYYRQWASFKVGSSVTLAGTAQESQGESNFKQTLTLKEVKGDYLMLAISRMEGSKSTNKPKKVDKYLSKNSKMADLGQEEITVAGKRYKCHRYKLTYFYDNGKEMLAFTYWFHPDIPGFAKVFAQSRDPETNHMDSATQTAVSWVKK